MLARTRTKVQEKIAREVVLEESLIGLTPSELPDPKSWPIGGVIAEKVLTINACTSSLTNIGKLSIVVRPPQIILPVLASLLGSGSDACCPSLLLFFSSVVLAPPSWLLVVIHTASTTITSPTRDPITIPTIPKLEIPSLLLLLEREDAGELVGGAGVTTGGVGA